MKQAFDPNRADFKGMTTAEQVFISALNRSARLIWVQPAKAHTGSG